MASLVPLQLMFVDLAWGGKAGEVTYPAFANPSAIRAVDNPAGKRIEQAHDSYRMWSD